MRLKRMSASNFCQHRELTVEFPPGITGILGPNGVGKSNAIKAVRFALIGDSGNAGTKVDDLNWQAAAAGESGAVELVFEQSGTEGKIKRFVNNARASLKFGEIKANSVSAVNRHMGTILGIPERTLKDIVFVMQGAIESILFERPADRAKKFQGLFGTESAERLRDFLLQEVNKLPTADVDERVERLQKELDVDVDPPLRELTKKQASVAAALKGFDRDAREAVIAKFETAVQIGQQLTELNERIIMLTTNVTPEVAHVAELQQQADDAEKETSQLTSRADEARAKLSNLDAARRAHETYEQLRGEAEKLEDVLRQPVPMSPGIDREKLEAGFEALHSMKVTLEPKRSFVETFKGGQGTVQCPTCLQDVHEADQLAAQFEAEVAQKTTEFAAVDQQLREGSSALVEYERDVELDCARKDTARERLQSVHGTLSTLGVTTYDGAEAGALQIVVDDFSGKLMVLKNVRDELSRLQVELARKKSECRTLEERQCSLREQLQDRPTADQYKRAKDGLEMVASAEAELGNIEGQLYQLRNRRGAILKELELLKQQTEKTEAVKKYKDLCERARTLFHRDCLPLTVTRAFLASLNVKIQEYLTLFGAPFSCQIKDDLTVSCNFPGGGEQSAERLSGGQRVVLGIAFRFAVYQLFAADLGFMVLDEPTAFLDDDRVQSVVEVMQSVRRYVHQTGMQLIVVTHEVELVAAFDHTVRL
ncbi:hypothetical protein LCGC14_0399710 [marine sediment metagenome]|uniref:RecF/RecN/SMC N-terminal domain-containing protein n=1 Tax=marine sediment metagenome TaxID=412755 RepID=A0A0F9T2R5_9ZZZZ